jgi:predicted AlkP superfamily phosphohydrolase/phosphomutase
MGRRGMGLFDRIRGGDDPRVAFFGIDGVPYSLIADNPDEFENLTALIDEGSGGAIDSIVPPESSACWPALTSGVNPGETGIYGFQDREVGSYDTYVPMRRDFQATRVWDRVQGEGRNATVMNVVTTFPPQRDVQRMVSGFLSPGVDKSAYPDEFRDHLQSIDWRMDTNASLGHEDKSAFMDDAHETLDQRQEAFLHYIDEDDWDLFFGVFMATDRVNHFLFRDYEEDGEHKEEFLEFYRKVDRYIGELREALADDVTMIVASDHGFTSLDYEVNLNAWLREQDYLSYADETDYTFQLTAWLREAGHVDVDPDYAGDIDELVDPAKLDIDFEDGALVADSEDARDEAVDAIEDAAPTVVDEDGDTATVVALDSVEIDTRVVEADDEDVETTEQYHVSADLARLEGEAYVDGGTVVALTDAAREDVVDRLEGATPASIGVDRSDTTPLVADLTVTEEGGAYHIAVSPTAETALGADPDPETDVLQYTHTELGDIADEATAYSLIPGRVYINLEGREPRGSVPEDEYDAVRSELKEKLQNMEGPDGEPVASQVVTKEDAFRGDHADIAPDLVVVPNHGFDLKSGFKGNKNPFVEFGARNGMHSFDNATLAIDDADARIGDVDLYDIAPTILDLMEIDYERSQFDGSSLV